MTYHMLHNRHAWQFVLFFLQDAWLDNIDNTYIDPKLAGKRVEVADEDESTELSSKEIGLMKRRMADVLLSGETVSFQLKLVSQLLPVHFFCAINQSMSFIVPRLQNVVSSQCEIIGCWIYSWKQPASHC